MGEEFWYESRYFERSSSSTDPPSADSPSEEFLRVILASPSTVALSRPLFIDDSPSASYFWGEGGGGGGERIGSVCS